MAGNPDYNSIYRYSRSALKSSCADMRLSVTDVAGRNCTGTFPPTATVDHVCDFIAAQIGVPPPTVRLPGESGFYPSSRRLASLPRNAYLSFQLLAPQPTDRTPYAPSIAFRRTLAVVRRPGSAEDVQQY
jgi:hypothetical protein